MRSTGGGRGAGACRRSRRNGADKGPAARRTFDERPAALAPAARSPAAARARDRVDPRRPSRGGRPRRGARRTTRRVRCALTEAWRDVIARDARLRRRRRHGVRRRSYERIANSVDRRHKLRRARCRSSTWPPPARASRPILSSSRRACANSTRTRSWSTLSSARLTACGRRTAKCTSSPPTARRSTNCATAATPTCRSSSERARTRACGNSPRCSTRWTSSSRASKPGFLSASAAGSLKLKSGLEVKLPEIDPQAAIATLLRLHRQSRILDRDVLALDLRVAGARVRAAVAGRRRPNGSTPMRRKKEGSHELPAAPAAHASDSGAQERDPVGSRHRRLENRLPDRAVDARWSRRARCAAEPTDARCSASAISVRTGSRAARSSIFRRRNMRRDSRSTRPSAWRASRSAASSSTCRAASSRRSALAPRLALRGKTVSEHDIHRVLEAASAANARPGRTVLHALPTTYSLDATRDVHDPKGMIGEELGVDLHVASCNSAAARNLMLVVERCHLRVEAMVATPYAAGLSTLVDDEAELGAAVVDFGGGTTTVGVFSGGRLIHVDAVAVGGIHVTQGYRARPQRVDDRRRAAKRRSTAPVSRRRRTTANRSPSTGSATTWIIPAICRNPSSCGSSVHASRRSSNSCATGCAPPGMPRRRAAGWS